MPPKKSELPGSPKIQELDEDKADEPSLPPMTPESKQLAAVIATAVATAMAGKSASPDSSSSGKMRRERHQRPQRQRANTVPGRVGAVSCVYVLSRVGKWQWPQSAEPGA